MTLQFTAEIEGDAEEIARKLDHISSQLRYGYRSGQDWDTEQK